MPESSISEWTRRENESPKAYQAFVIYRDLGPDRSIDAAYTQFHKGSKTEASGRWESWSCIHEWVKRAAAFDAHLDQVKRAARARALARLIEQRADDEIREQIEIREMVLLAGNMLKEYAKLPIRDGVHESTVTDKKTGAVTVTKTKIKGADLAKVSRLLKERNATVRQMVVGPRKELEEKSSPVAAPPFIVQVVRETDPVDAPAE